MGQDGTIDLVAAYEPFVATFLEGGFDEPADDDWNADMIAAHVARNNECFTIAARTALVGGEPVYDNEVAVDDDALRAHVERIGDRTALAAWVRRSAEELAALHAALSDEQKAMPMPTLIRSDGAVVVDDVRPLAAMIEGNATYHLTMHHEQLLALRP